MVHSPAIGWRYSVHYHKVSHDVMVNSSMASDLGESTQMEATVLLKLVLEHTLALSTIFCLLELSY